MPPEFPLGEDVLQRFDRTMFAMSGADTKAAMFLHALSPNPKSIGEIYDQVHEQVPGITWFPSPWVLESRYLEFYLCPAGAAYRSKKDGCTRYASTEEGEIIDKGAASLFNIYSADNNLPVLSYFSQRSPQNGEVKNRGYIARTAILLYLSQKDSSYSEINQLLDGYKGVRDNLKRLQRAGFITTEFTGLKQPDVRINDKGRRFLNQVLIPIIKACAGDPNYLKVLAEAREYVEHYPEITSRVINLYREASSDISHADMVNAIMNTIRVKGAHAREIRDTLGERAQPVLNDLIKKGMLVKHRVGRAVLYLIPGMEVPQNISVPVVVRRAQPEKITRQYRNKEEYVKDLETPAFWEGLITDLQTIFPRSTTERSFFSYFDPKNPRWQAKDNYKSGKYANHARVLKDYSSTEPYLYLRNYQPVSEDPNLKRLIAKTQQLMEEKLDLRRIVRISRSTLKRELLNIFPSDATDEEVLCIQTLFETMPPVLEGVKPEHVAGRMLELTATAEKEHCISPRQRDMLCARFGLKDGNSISMREIEIRFGLSPKQTTTLLSDALRNLASIPVRAESSVPQIADGQKTPAAMNGWNLVEETEEAIKRSTNPLSVSVLRKIQTLHDPEEFAAIASWSADRIAILANQLPETGAKVNFSLLKLSPYVAILINFIVSTEFGLVKTFDPNDIVLDRIFKEDLLACVEILRKISKKNGNITLADLFKMQVAKAVAFL